MPDPSERWVRLPRPVAGVRGTPGPTSPPLCRRLWSLTIEGLLPNTPDGHGLYHFRIVATNSAGESKGPDQTVTTLPPDPPLVDETSSSGITATGASLAAMVNPNQGLTFYQFEFGGTEAYGSHTLPSDPIGDDAAFHPVADTLSGLQPSTTYHYRVVATNFGGTTFGPDRTFTTADAPVPPAPPLVPAAKGPSSAATTQPSTPSGPTVKKPRNCRKKFVKRKGKCVKKKHKKHKKRKKRSNGHG